MALFTCTVTGTLTNAAGVVQANTTLYLKQLNTKAQSGQVIVAGTQTVTSDGAGAVSFTIAPGNYRAEIPNVDKFRVRVPDAATAAFSDIIDGPDVNVTPQALRLAQQYAGEAQAWANTTGGVPYANRAAAVAATVADAITRIWVLTPNGETLAYYRDASGTALTTNGGTVNWSPDGDVHVDHFGENATPGTTDMTAAFTAAVTWARNEERNVHFLGEHYVIDTTVINSIEGVNFYGTSGGDPVTNNAGTWIYWKSGSTGDYLLGIKSCRYVKFYDINFFANSLTGKNALIEFQCNPTGSVAPLNQFASTGIRFHRCAFVVSEASTMSIATINAKSINTVFFEDCVIYGNRAIRLGADADAGTVPDGRAANVDISGGILYGDIDLQRIDTVTIRNVYWGKNSVAASGSDYWASGITCSGNEEVRNVVLINNIVDSDGIDINRQDWCKLPVSPPTGVVPTMTVIGGTFQSYRRAFHVPTGKLVCDGATFIAQSRAGGTGLYAAFYLSGTGHEVTHNGCGFAGLLALNTTSLVAQALVDARSTEIEDDKYLLARQLATSVAFSSTGTWQTVLSRTLSQVDGGRVEMSYTVAISSAVAATFNARIRINGVVMDASYQRFTITTATATLFCFSLAPTVVMVDASDDLDTPTVELQVQQSSGSPLATIQGEDSTFQRTQALVRVV